MIRIIILTCIGVCIGQTPAHTYLRFVGSPYLSNGPRLNGDSSPGSIQPGNPADGIQNGGSSVGNIENSNGTIQDINAYTGLSEIEINGQSDSQTGYHGSLVPQSRLLSAARSHGIPAPLFIPGLSPISPYINDPSSQASLGATPYGYDVESAQNSGSPSIRATSRSDNDRQLNPHYSGPSLFYLSAQAAEERRSSLPLHQQPTLRVGVDTSIHNAVPISRTSFDGYYDSGESQTNHPSGQNGHIQQVTQGTLDPASYQFSYDVNAVESGRSVQFAHEEQRGLDQTAGTYSVLLPDGQRQIVEYTADQDGYRPRVSYANDIGRDPTVGNEGAETDVYVDGNYGSSVIAARSNLSPRRQPLSVERRYQQTQDARTRQQTRPY